MTGDLRVAISHDLQQLAADLGCWLTQERGGSLVANRELAADYLMDVKHMKSADVLTELTQYAAHAR